MSHGPQNPGIAVLFVSSVRDGRGQGRMTESGDWIEHRELIVDLIRELE